jgi:hypothetical protein
MPLSHRPQPRFGKLELGQLPLEADGGQGAQHRQSTWQVGSGEKNQPGVAGRQADANLHLVALQTSDRGARPLQRQLELECGAKVLPGEMTEIHPFRGRPAW